jgi:LmbE family N-acetylglucosaminyl deacetylase
VITAERLHKLWRELPIASMHEIIGDGTCLILAPHPDDETLGCGGLIATCCARSRPPLVAILTDGRGSHSNSQSYPASKLIALREAEATEAVNILGLPIERLIFLREPDTKAPHAGQDFETIVDRLADYVRGFGCSTILAPWRHDPHCDHQAASRIACETARVAGIRALAYPVWGWTISTKLVIDATEPQGWRLDVTPHLSAKRHAIAAHASQFGRCVTDDPTGFVLPESLLQALAKPWETFLVP